MKFGDQRIIIKQEQTRESNQNKGFVLNKEIYHQLEQLAGSIGMTVEEMCKIAIKMKKGE